MPGDEVEQEETTPPLTETEAVGGASKPISRRRRLLVRRSLLSLRLSSPGYYWLT